MTCLKRTPFSLNSAPLPRRRAFSPRLFSCVRLVCPAYCPCPACEYEVRRLRVWCALPMAFGPYSYIQFRLCAYKLAVISVE